MYRTWHKLLRSCSERTEESPERPEAGSELASDTERVLFALAKAVEQRDAKTAGHCERLAFISVAMGAALGLERETLLALYRGAYLHDVGKVGIPDSILFKPGPLTAREWVTVRSHPVRGEEICRPMKSLRSILPIIRYHHERWNGSGYPDGLCGEQIPLLARIVQIADIYDSLTMPRPYKTAFSQARALAILAEETRRGWRDPRIYRVFARIHKEVAEKMTHPRRRNRDLESMSRSLVNLRNALSPESRELIAG